MSYYKIDFRALVQLLLPAVVRGKTLAAFLTSIVVPVSKLHVLLLAFKSDIDYRLYHNSQVCFLQSVLNDHFDYNGRGIYITDPDISEWSQFLWKEEHDLPIMLGTYYLNRELFLGSDAIDFIVHVPFALGLSDNDLIKMNALIRNYKLAGKRYVIMKRL